MPSRSIGCRIKVVKRMVQRDLIDTYMEDQYADRGPCEVFEDGQEFEFDGYSALEKVPEGFCPSAWADIRQDVFTLLVGGNIPGMKEQGTVVSSCHDWFRPVLFEIRRLNHE